MPQEPADNSNGFDVLENHKLAKQNSSILLEVTAPKPPSSKPSGPTLAEQIGVYGGLGNLGGTKKSLPFMNSRSFFNR